MINVDPIVIILSSNMLMVILFTIQLWRNERYDRIIKSIIKRLVESEDKL